MLFPPLRTGGFTTLTIYDAIILVVNSRHSVKGIISMPFAQCHVFLLNGQRLQTTSTATTMTGCVLVQNTFTFESLS